MAWMRLYYPGPNGVLTGQFLPKQLPKKPVEIPTLSPIKPIELPSLTQDQATALRSIGAQGLHLLHGNTGTGKTRVYIELARQSIASGKSAIILTPEIGLTSQLADDFTQIFGNRVVVVHSQLTDVTRQRIWLRLLKQTEPVILLGPRSALFSPLGQVGLIVIDESHETAYKQDQAPYYHATTVAAKLASLHACPVVLGSATPLVTDYYMAEQKRRPIVRMLQTASTSGSKKSSVSVVDLRDRSLFTKKSYLSDMLIDATRQAIERGEQTLLFLNRRGTARIVFCEQCGWQSSCPHCDTPLIYHGDSHLMRCHTCGYTASAPASCPSCHSASVTFKSIGTKAVVDQVSRLFPDAKIQRFDTDNKKDERIEQHYQSVKDGNIDIIVGTQTLAKGLDLPKLSVVGVLLADTSLSFPDFSAQERTYQLLAQVLGRVGRGHRASRAIIQTYNPQSPLLHSILAKDWTTFYTAELVERRTFMFPPYCFLLKLVCRRATANSAQQAASMLATKLKSSGLPILIEGPAPAFHEKIQNKYQWQLIVKAKNRDLLIAIIRDLPNGWSHDIDPMNLL
jgi:primosomal protein N' (replication factor Y)